MRARVPFRLVGGAQPLIVLPTRFNGGEPIDCVLDTGASHAMLLPALADRLGVAADEVKEARGAGGAVRVAIGRARTLAVGAIEARDVPVLISDELRRISTALGAPLGGGIGYSFLSRYRLTVDYAELAITLATPEETIDAAPVRTELTFTLAHPNKPLILVPVMVEGTPFRFAIDTGASTTVVSPSVAQGPALEGAAASGMTGGGGTVAAAPGMIPTQAIGGVRLARVRAMVAAFVDDIGAAAWAPIHGIIGGNVLRRFRVTIDYPRALLRLE